MNYQPKGSMCAACVKKHDDCSKLDFSKMRAWGEVIETKTVIVICTQYKRCNQQWLESK